MKKVRDVIEVMENWAPSSLAETWDNVGLITGDPDSVITSVLLTLDVTETTITHALKNQTSLIITHHPPIFKPLSNLTETTMSSRVIRMAVKEDISIYASHTNLDQAPDGVSASLAQKLQLESVSPLSPGTSGLVKFVIFTPPEYTDRVRDAVIQRVYGITGEYRFCSFTSRGSGTNIPSSVQTQYQEKHDNISHVSEDRLEMILPSPLVPFSVDEARKAYPHKEMVYDLIPLSNADNTFGYGALGNLRNEMNASQFSEYVAGALDVKELKVSKGNNKHIQTVAVMGGSGKNYINSAIHKGADAYITGDLGYHDFMEYGTSILLIDASHRATELPVLERIKERLFSTDFGERVEIILDVGEKITTIFTY